MSKGKSIKVCFFSKYPPIEGGISSRTYWLSRALGKRGMEIHIITNALEVEEEYRETFDFEKLEEYARLLNITYKNKIELVKNKEIVSFILAEINKCTPNLAPYEKVKKIVLLYREFEEDKGELTPTLKVKRKIVEEKYRDLIDSMYED